jgi:hypothetical protein
VCVCVCVLVVVVGPKMVAAVFRGAGVVASMAGVAGLASMAGMAAARVYSGSSTQPARRAAHRPSRASAPTPYTKQTASHGSPLVS